ncbi:hypothetical protein [Nocardioides pantholopis]|uniref:hypothetical protein n=1 Tax=Nocardioides pantholopis TaxID=2483798 RepID=UPI000FD96244|nr:hypothetical protein [Nocardioides pantholopis]
MRTGEDFDAYVAARWPELVRTVALLGCPDPLAPDIAADALARCRGPWARISRDDDVEVAVHTELLAAWARRRRTAWWVGLPGPAEPEDDDPRRAEAEAVLDTLDPAARAAVVLAAVGGLAEHQVAEVVGDPDRPGTSVSSGLVQAAAATVEVPPAPLAGLSARAGAVTRRRRVAAAGSAVAVLAAGLVVWAVVPSGTPVPSSSSDPADEGQVRAAENPAALPWYADGVLHLDEVEVEMPPLRDLVRAGDGVVASDLAGRVWSVDGTGRRRELGQTYPNLDLVASAVDDRVAWADTRRRQLVVVDARTGRTTATVSGMVRVPVALDGTTLVARGPEGTTALHRRTGAEEPVDDVVDTRSGTWVVRRDGHTVEVTRPDGSSRVVPADTARLSLGGEFLLTRTGLERAVAVHDLRAGRELDSGIGPDEISLDSELGPGGTVVHLVARAVDRGEGPEAGYARLSEAGTVTLRTCELLTGRCRTDATVAGSGPSPLVAH